MKYNLEEEKLVSERFAVIDASVDSRMTCTCTERHDSQTCDMIDEYRRVNDF